MLKKSYQDKQRKLYKDIAEVLHQARVSRASWIERIILKHLARKHKLPESKETKK